MYIDIYLYICTYIYIDLRCVLQIQVPLALVGEMTLFEFFLYY